MVLCGRHPRSVHIDLLARCDATTYFTVHSYILSFRSFITRKSMLVLRSELVAGAKVSVIVYFALVATSPTSILHPDHRVDSEPFAPPSSRPSHCSSILPSPPVDPSLHLALCQNYPAPTKPGRHRAWQATTHVSFSTRSDSLISSIHPRQLPACSPRACSRPTPRGFPRLGMKYPQQPSARASPSPSSSRRGLASSPNGGSGT